MSDITLPSNSVSDAFNSSTNLTDSAGTTTFTAGSQLAPSVIEQTERLFTTRTRGINHLSGDGDRGQRTFIRVMSSDAQTSLNNHLSELASETTSLGTSTSGVLSDALNDGAKYGGYASFLLTDIRGSFEEKLQVSEVFGDAEVVYYFGRQPIQMDFSGLLVDSPDNNWFVQWMEMYAHVLRGTQLARNYELVKIVTPNMTLIGSITRMSWNQNSDHDQLIPFQFTFLAKEIIPTPVVGNGEATGDSGLIDFNKVESFKTQSDITSQKSQLGAILNVVKDPFSTVQDYAGALSNSVFGGSGNPTGSLGMMGINNDAGSGLNSEIGSGTGTAAVSNSGIFASVSSNLAGIRASLFSPVYGVLSSLTKLIKSTTGSVTSVINSFVNPVRDILRDIRSISNQAIGIVNLINNSIRSVTNIEKRLDVELRSTLALLKKTAGVISTAPQSITSNLRDLVNAGKLPATVGFLQNRPGTSLSSGVSGGGGKLALLNSGPRHTAESGATL